MSKYHARKVVDDGETFDSLAEHRRWCELKLLVASGHITDLQAHPRFPLVVNGVKLGYYEADSQYNEYGTLVVEDVKGVKTAVYRLKAKLVKALHGITIREIEA